MEVPELFSASFFLSESGRLAWRISDLLALTVWDNGSNNVLHLELGCCSDLGGHRGH